MNPNELAQHVIDSVDGDFTKVGEVIQNLTQYLVDALD